MSLISSGMQEPTEMYCDMETSDGGFTLVYSYGFTNYTFFKDISNAVTPVPNWPIPNGYLSQGKYSSICKPVKQLQKILVSRINCNA